MLNKGSLGLEAVFFDIDNTLYDQFQAYKMGLSRVINHFDNLFENIDKEEVIDAFFKGDRELMKVFRDGESLERGRLIRIKEMLRLLELDKDYAEEINDYFIDIYPTMNTPIEGAEDIIKELKNLYRVGVISNGTKDIQLQKLESINLKYAFEIIILSEVIGIRKPNPAIFEKGSKFFNLPSKKCMYVGNLYETDIVGAKKANMKACWYNQRNKERKNKEIEPDFEIKELRELLELLG